MIATPDLYAHEQEWYKLHPDTQVGEVYRILDEMDDVLPELDHKRECAIAIANRYIGGEAEEFVDFFARRGVINLTA